MPLEKSAKRHNYQLLCIGMVLSYEMENSELLGNNKSHYFVAVHLLFHKMYNQNKSINSTEVRQMGLFQKKKGQPNKQYFE